MYVRETGLFLVFCPHKALSRPVVSVARELDQVCSGELSKSKDEISLTGASAHVLFFDRLAPNSLCREESSGAAPAPTSCHPLTDTSHRTHPRLSDQLEGHLCPFASLFVPIVPRERQLPWRAFMQMCLGSTGLGGPTEACVLLFPPLREETFECGETRQSSWEHPSLFITLKRK